MIEVSQLFDTLSIQWHKICSSNCFTNFEFPIYCIFDKHDCCYLVFTYTVHIRINKLPNLTKIHEKNCWNKSVKLSDESVISMCKWQHGLLSFLAGVQNLKGFCLRINQYWNQHAQRKLLNYNNWVNGEVSKSAIFFIEEYQFRSTFLVIDFS